MKQHFDVLPRLLTDHRVQRFAEIGVWNGTFMRNMLRQVGCYLDQYWGIDQWKVLEKEKPRMMGRLKQEQWDAKYLAVCKIQTYLHNARILKLPSLEAAPLFPDGYFDMVYIDASHFYKHVLLDIDAWKPKVRPGGILGGHDYINKRASLTAKQAVDEKFPEGVNTMEDMIWWVQL
jgi:hypothetical protein